jgi:lysozyme
LLGAYHVLEPNADPLTQADHFLSLYQQGAEITLTTATQEGGAHPPMLPPALDFELARGETGRQALEAAVAWLQAVEGSLGRRCLVYVSPSFVEGLEKLAGAAADGAVVELARRPLWVAHYGVATPRVPAPWQDWTLWQASGDHSAMLPGSRTDVDIDWYRGDAVSLAALGTAGGEDGC